MCSQDLAGHKTSQAKYIRPNYQEAQVEKIKQNIIRLLDRATLKQLRLIYLVSYELIHKS